MILRAEDVTVRFDGRSAVDGVSLAVAPGELVAIIGPNGSGKTTLMRTMARLLKPQRGRIVLDGRDLSSYRSRKIARRIAVLPQLPEVAHDLTVEELVWRGRYPHQGLLQRARPIDADAVEWAMDAADVATLRDRQLASLSGGERQRAWIALALAQQPDVLLLDEPTSFLDIQHQIEVMHLLRRLNGQGMTIVAVLHDLPLAARFARRVVAMRNGRILWDGPPPDIMVPEKLEAVFGVPMMTVRDPESGQPIPLPRAQDICVVPRPGPGN